MTEDPNREQRPESPSVVWARYSEIAFIIPAGVVAGLLMGKLADYWLHSRWAVVAGVAIGAIAGFVQMIRMVTRQKI